MEKVVKSRKNYPCVLCDAAIEKGEKHTQVRMRMARYADFFCEEKQVGIAYGQYRKHIQCPEWASRHWTDDEPNEGSPMPDYF